MTWYPIPAEAWTYSMDRNLEPPGNVFSPYLACMSIVLTWMTCSLARMLPIGVFIGVRTGEVLEVILVTEWILIMLIATIAQPGPVGVLVMVNITTLRMTATKSLATHVALVSTKRAVEKSHQGYAQYALQNHQDLLFTLVMGV